MTGESELKDGPFLDLIFLAFADELSIQVNTKAMADKITARESTLVELVEALGPKLTSSNVQDRVKATEILAHVFSAFPEDFLSEKELEFIVEFLSNRLKDQHLVIPKTVHCIYPVIQSRHLPKGAGARLLHQIFQEANVQSHIHKTRRTVFLIIAFLLRTKLDELKELSSDFVINFLQAIDGEKDPRNLLLLFQIIPIVIDNFNLGPFNEDFFEVLAVYFPIDFSPTVAVSGENFITRETLADALHACLSQTNKFSEFLVPLAMEKLDSSLIDAKIDSLRLLELCCEKCYEPVHLQPFMAQIWHSLRREIFMGGNESVESRSMSFLQSAFKVVSRDEGVLKTCVELIFTECKHHLCEPELRLINPTSKILVGMCSASQRSCEVVAPRIFQTLIEQLTKKTVQGERKKIMEITGQILEICRSYAEVGLKDHVDNWEDMVVTWFSFLTNDDHEFGTLSLKVLYQALRNELDFPEKLRELLQIHILAMIEKGTLSKGTLMAIIDIAGILVTNHGSELAASSVLKLLENINMSTSSSGVDNDNERSESESGKVVVGKAWISTIILAECSLNNENVYEKVVSHLLTEITPVSVNIKAMQCLSRTVEKVSLNMIKIKDKAPEELEGSLSLRFTTLLVEKLRVFDSIFSLSIRIYQHQPFSGESTETNANAIFDAEENSLTMSTLTLKDTNAFRMCVTILRNLMRSADVEMQEKLIARFWKELVKDKSWEDCFKELPFPVAEAMLGPLWPSVEIHRRTEFTQYLVKNCVQSQSSNKLMHRRLLAAFLNKLEPDVQFQDLLKCIGNSVDNIIADHCDPINSKSNEKPSEDMKMDVDLPEGFELHNAVHLLAWIIKSLAMRGLKELNDWVEKLVNLLSIETVGAVAAQGFSTILSDDPITLNPQNHCKFRFLYKQRIFQMSVPRLVVGYQAAKSNAIKANFIKALSSQLKYIPKEIMGMEIENVFPLLVASLKVNSDSGAVVLSTLTAFTEMMGNSDEETDKKLVEFSYEIIPQMLKLAGFPGLMEVRVMALKCLQKCAKCPLHVILPFRQQVIDDLLKPIDDHKRLVRTEARLTRNIWILVGSPGGI